MLLAGLLMAALIALLPIWGMAFAVVCMLVAGAAGSIVNVVLFTAIQLAIPRHLMGRVMGLLLFGSFGVYPLSVALAGVLTDHLGRSSFRSVGSAGPGPGHWHDAAGTARILAQRLTGRGSATNAMDSSRRNGQMFDERSHSSHV